MMETLFVSNYLDGDRFTRTMIFALKHLAERPFSECVYDFVSVCQVIMVYHLIVASIVIVTIIIRRYVTSRQFLLGPVANVINRRIIQNFLALVIR